MKKKILFFTPGAVGGAERMTVTIAKMLPLDQFDVHIVIVGKTTKICDFIPNTMRVSHILCQNKYSFITIRILWKIICEKPDVVFTSTVLLNPRVIIASRLAGVKVIVRSSGMVGYYNKRNVIKVKLTYPLATILIAQQEEMRQEMSKMLHIPLERITTLTNPLDLESIEAKRYAPSPFDNDGCRHYVNVSRINRVKGHDIAIRALSEVRKHISNAHLYFVGRYDTSDSYYQQLQQLITESHLQDYVHFIGYDDNPYRWVAHADCFVFPSRHEGLPNALIEASYLGIPCVATRCLTIISEIIRDGYNGFTVEVDDVEAFAKSMESAVDLKDFEMLYHSAIPADFVKLFDYIVCQK